MTDRELLKGTIDVLSFIANAYDDDMTVAQCACMAYEMANTARAKLVILKKHLAAAPDMAAEIVKLRKWQSEAVKLIDGCLAMPSELADRLIKEAEEQGE